MQFLEDLYAIVVFAWILPFVPPNRLLYQKHARLILFLFICAILARVLVLTIGPSIPPFVAFTGLCARLLFIPAAYLFIRNQLKKSAGSKSRLIHLTPIAVFTLFCFIYYLSNGALNFLAVSYQNHFAVSSPDL